MPACGARGTVLHQVARAARLGLATKEHMYYNAAILSMEPEEPAMSKRNVVHIEIPAADVASAGKFYESLFGWKLEHVPEMNYTMWEPGEGPGGGFTEVTTESPVGQVMIHISSDDIEADLKQAEKLGGKIVRHKTEIPNIGWWGTFKDPTGNVLALYTSKNPEFNK